MTENETNSSSLISIIKIEPEEFQTIKTCSTSTSDQIFKEKAKIFLEPAVLLERISSKKIEPITFSKQKTIKQEPESDENSVLEFVNTENAEKTNFKPHTCSLCKKVFSKRANILLHLKNIHGQAPELFCDLCPKTFRLRSHMTRHVKTHGMEAFACDVCDFRTVHKQNLEGHKKTHLKREKCKICSKQVASLKDHMIYHTKEPCPICKKAFSKYNVIRHMRLVHDEGRRKCTDCDSSFPTKEDLRRHKLEQHYEGKLHRCHCGSVFKSTYDLNFHQKVHKTEKVECDVCKRQFKHPHNFRVHWKKAHSKTYK